MRLRCRATSRCSFGLEKSIAGRLSKSGRWWTIVISMLTPKSSPVSFKNCYRILKRCFTLNSVREKAKKKQHEIFVPPGKLTSKNLGPTPIELYELMHLTSCDHAIKRWKDHWLVCPVCNEPIQLAFDQNGVMIGMTLHKSRKDRAH